MVSNFLFYAVLFFSMFPIKYSEILSTGLLIIIITINCLYSLNRKKLPTLVFNSFTLIIFIWYLYSIYTKSWVINITRWEYNHTYLLIALLTSITISFKLNEKDFIKNTLNIISLYSGVHIIIGLFEVFTGRYLFTSNLTILNWYKASKYPVSFFYNTNDYATFLLFSIIVFLTLNFFSKERKEANLIYSIRNIGVFLSFVLVFKTDSRIITLLSLLTIGTYFILKYDLLNNKSIRYLILSILGASVLIFIYLQRYNIQAFIFSDASGETRLSWMLDAIQLLKINNYKGVGTGNYSDVYQIYRGGYDNSNISVHNWWLEVLVTYGLVFFLMYLIYYINKTIQAYKLLISKKTNLFYLIWIIVFIPASLASSTQFDKIWVWIINIFVIQSLIKTQRLFNFVNRKDNDNEIR